MSDKVFHEFFLVVEQRGVGEHELSVKPYHITRYKKLTEEKARKALVDWHEVKDRVADDGATFMANWTAHIETRTVTESTWERLEA